MYRVDAAPLLDAGSIERLEIDRMHASKHASPNRLKTGLQTNEQPLVAVSVPFQRFNLKTAV